VQAGQVKTPFLKKKNAPSFLHQLAEQEQIRVRSVLFHHGTAFMIHVPFVVRYTQLNRRTPRLPELPCRATPLLSGSSVAAYSNRTVPTTSIVEHLRQHE